MMALSSGILLVFLIWRLCDRTTGFVTDPRLAPVLDGNRVVVTGGNETVRRMVRTSGNGTIDQDREDGWSVNATNVDKRHIDSYPDPFEGIYVDDYDDLLTPGIRIRVNRVGIDVAHQIFEKVVDSKIQDFIQSYKIPDYVQNITGDQVCQTRNNRVAQFVVPEFAYALNPHGNTIVWTTHGGFMNVTGEWSADNGVIDGMPDSSGEYAITLRDVFLIMEIQPVIDSGVPGVGVIACNATILKSSINFTGGTFAFRMILNAVGTLMMSQLEDILADQFCARASELMEFRINHRLKQFPVSVPVLHEYPVTMQTRPVSEIVVGEEYVEGYLEGCFSWENETCARYYQPFPDPPSALADRMIVVQFTEAVFHSFMHVLFEQNLIGIDINAEAFPEYAKMLRTECKGLCIGSASALLGERFPNRSVAIRISALHPIYLRISAQAGMLWSAEAELVGEVEGLENDEDYLEGADQEDIEQLGRIMSGLVAMNGSMTNLRVEEGRFHADMLVDNLDISGVSSSFEDFPPAKVEQIARLVFKSERAMIEREMSGWLVHGIPLPLMPTLEIRPGPVTVVQEGAVAVGFDVEYNWGDWA